MNELKIEENLMSVLMEISNQVEVGKSFPIEVQSHSEQVSQIQEYIIEAGEYGIAYECLVCLLENHPFVLTGRVVIKLLEVGLFLKFKTDRAEDSEFDSRRS